MFIRHIYTHSVYIYAGTYLRIYTYIPTYSKETADRIVKSVRAHVCLRLHVRKPYVFIKSSNVFNPPIIHAAGDGITNSPMLCLCKRRDYHQYTIQIYRLAFVHIDTSEDLISCRKMRQRDCMRQSLKWYSDFISCAHMWDMTVLCACACLPVRVYVSECLDGWMGGWTTLVGGGWVCNWRVFIFCRVCVCFCVCTCVFARARPYSARALWWQEAGKKRITAVLDPITSTLTAFEVCGSLQHTAPHYDALQHTVTHCNTLMQKAHH